MWEITSSFTTMFLTSMGMHQSIIVKFNMQHLEKRRKEIEGENRKGKERRQEKKCYKNLSILQT